MKKRVVPDRKTPKIPKIPKTKPYKYGTPKIRADFTITPESKANLKLAASQLRDEYGMRVSMSDLIDRIAFKILGDEAELKKLAKVLGLHLFD